MPLIARWLTFCDPLGSPGCALLTLLVLGRSLVDPEVPSGPACCRKRLPNTVFNLFWGILGPSICPSHPSYQRANSISKHNVSRLEFVKVLKVAYCFFGVRFGHSFWSLLYHHLAVKGCPRNPHGDRRHLKDINVFFAI